MARKKYSDFKNDPTVKVPPIAWLMDKWEFYAVILLVGTFAAWSFLIQPNFASVSNIVADPEVVSEYQDIAGRKTPGLVWATELAKQQPLEDMNEWKISDTTKPLKISIPGCTITDGVPVSQIGTTISQGDGIRTEIEVYGAGQATKQFSKYAEISKDCAGMTVATNDNGSVATGSGITIITMGDAIISVTYPADIDNERKQHLINFYISVGADTLKATECIALKVAAEDSGRSFFYNREGYIGLTETKPLSTNVDFSGLPRITGVSLAQINTPGLELPEAPLPEGFPQMPAKAVVAPALPTTPELRDSFDGDAKFKIADTYGPGCGWAWSSQISPAYSKQSLASEKKKTITAKQKELDAAATDYVSTNMDWATSMFALSVQADAWNKYAKSINSIHDKWNWLNNERMKLYEPWVNYVEAHKTWEQFDANKASALETYKGALKTCQTQQDELTAWEEKYGNKITDPTPPTTENGGTTTNNPAENIPPRPAGCTEIPAQPAILSQEKPAEPQPPAIPEGVTIPNSWPKV